MCVTAGMWKKSKHVHSSSPGNFYYKLTSFGSTVNFWRAVLIRHLFLRYRITSDKEKEKQADRVGIQYEQVRKRLREYRSLQKHPLAVIVSAGGVISQTAPKSADPLPALAICQSWLETPGGHCTAVCSFTRQDHTWQVKSLWTVLLLLMASWSWCVWVCVRLQGKMSNTCKTVKRYAQNIQNRTHRVLVWVSFVEQPPPQKKAQRVLCVCVCAWVKVKED